ncbi:Potassium-transporting ATPase KdpC subunit [Mycolicibacterium vanbaalenii]|uniref:Potassium-transporting ATPase KdpC subunit n=1 Tax=Mycolicibacterium vanbaalenii TaxID=110539 RepID=A0A5S9R8S1_MYCVN|nr:K(+)-transporting ATPase subunit C [Mycolicibacterium vanbaalenii]CAA0132241.1 Potassium-transporting ATPase KdpC subunit [Mycolicibacterium vanbaalenii]
MRRQFLPALLMLVVFTVITGIGYPLLVTGVGQLLLRDKANGSLIEQDGRIVGSAQIGQQFTQPRYFHPRPSDAVDGYDSLSSSGSNLGPTNEEFLQTVADRVEQYRSDNDLDPQTLVPVDAVTGSGSGLDPAISVANAMLQAPRVAAARDLSVELLERLIEQNTEGRSLGFLGEPAVNVLLLNLALDRL